MKGRPYLLLEARIIEESRLPEFERWYREVQAPRILQIPGITACRRLHAAEPGRFMVLYELADEGVIHAALQSQEARRAREQWRAWLGHLETLTLEVYASLRPAVAEVRRN